MTPAIELKGLGRRYGRHLVLEDVNLVVAPGKTVVLRGANGAGKTTLLRVLSTRLRPSRGAGCVFGHDLVKEGGQVRKRIAYLSVLGGSYGNLSALENLRLAARLRGRRPASGELEAYLAEVGLEGARHKLARSFSSGMKKRLGLARLLLAEADLWLLDEPYAALDENGRTLVDGLLARARAVGRTVVMASHEPGCAPADGTLLLTGGRLARLGRAPEEAEAAHA